MSQYTPLIYYQQTDLTNLLLKIQLSRFSIIFTAEFMLSLLILVYIIFNLIRLVMTQPSTRQHHRMVKHTQTIGREQLTAYIGYFSRIYILPRHDFFINAAIVKNLCKIILTTKIMASQISDATASMVFFVKTKCKKNSFQKIKVVRLRVT